MKGCEPDRLENIAIVYNRTFILLTSPTTPKGTARVLDSGLVNVNYIRYFHEQLLDPELLGQNLPVRYDPWDAGVAWVYAHKMWIECHSEHYAELQGKSKKLIDIIVDRIHERNKLYPLARLTVNAATIAQFLKELHRDEEVLQQMQHDREAKQVRDRLSNPVSPSPAQEIPAAAPEPVEGGERAAVASQTLRGARWRPLKSPNRFCGPTLIVASRGFAAELCFTTI